MSRKVQKFGIQQARRLLPQRSRSSNKTTGGRALIVAGSQGMFGAALLAAEACARIGAGYTFLMTDTSRFPLARHPDFLIRSWNSKNIKAVQPSVIAVGPGISTEARSKSMIRHLLKTSEVPIVADADALNCLAQMKVHPLPSDWILTPHEGELARLLEVSSDQIRKDRRDAVIRAYKKFSCTVVLKGYRTLVACDRGLFEIQSGNPALAKAGTGDVLTGMISGLLSQGFSPKDAACLGAFIHGFLADEWVRNHRDPLSLLATDLVQSLPTGLARLRKA